MINKESGYILITGASGFVGWHLTRAFAAEGWRTAGSFLTNPVQLAPAETFPIDLTDAGAVSRLLRDMKPSAIVHCAAETKVGWCEEHPKEARAAILTATENICAAVSRRAPQTPLIHFSTDLVFDGTAAPYSADAPAKPLSAYGSLKSESERAVLGLENGRVLRAALVYGPPARWKTSFLSWMVDKFAKNEDLTLFEDEWRTPVYVKDLVEAVRLLLTSVNGPGVFHAGGPDRLNRVEMGHVVSDCFGLSSDSIRITRRQDIPGGVLRPRDVSLDSSALRNLGWTPTPFSDGIKKCKELWQS